ncbi:MAG: hypothetical protein EU544_04930 [Promethearchaeota archaeon]|nr:MAG: hypothetical protein EU544_04930 [Candidatus Lokiarchaeota archaeon]
MKMREVSEKDRLFYFERHFFTLDGLWMIETEEETDWKTALKIDTEVWKRLLKIIIRRLKKYLNLEENSLANLIEILTFRWSVEKWKYEIVKKEPDEAIIHVEKCPYHEIMKRNPERHDKIPLICKDMCIPFYEDIVKNFNSKISLDRKKYQGLGDPICDFHFTVEE